MSTLHREPTELRTLEKSPLDRAIDNYQRQAERYFKKLDETSRATPDVREKRKQELEEAKRHLENERRILSCIGDVQADLEAYREEGRAAVRKPGQPRGQSEEARKRLLVEEHHPTAILEAHMRAVPNPKPSPNHAAHHIVPGKGKTKFANRARIRMHLFGVRINDPDNGVWLPKSTAHTPNWSMPNSLSHLQYHTHGYEKWIYERLEARSGEAFIRQELQLIGKRLKQNNLPPETRKKS